MPDGSGKTMNLFEVGRRKFSQIPYIFVKRGPETLAGTQKKRATKQIEAPVAGASIGAEWLPWGEEERTLSRPIYGASCDEDLRQRPEGRCRASSGSKAPVYSQVRNRPQ